MIIFRNFLAMALLLIIAPATLSQTLVGLDFNQLADKRVEFILSFDEKLPLYSIEDEHQPARIVIDLKNTKLALTKNNFSLNFDNLIDVLSLAVKDDIRMLVNLKQLAPYQVGVADRRLFLVVGAADDSTDDHFVNSDGNRVTAIKTGGRAQPEREPEKDIVWTNSDQSTIQLTPADSHRVTQPLRQSFNRPKQLSMVDFDFSLGEQNQAIVAMKFSNSAIDVDIQRHHRHLLLQFSNATLADDLKRQFEAFDFNSVVKLINLYTKGADVIIAIEVDSDYDYFTYQTDNSYFIQLSENAFAPPQVSSSSNLAYVGRTISLNFSEMPLINSIAKIAEFVAINTHISPNIAGTTKLRLNEIAWNKALYSLLAINGLASQWHNQTLFIAPQTEIDDFISNLKQSSHAATLLAIRYADAVQIQELIEQSGLLSKEGKIVADKRSNRLLINDYQANIDNITNIVTDLDQEAQQVVIEARLVIVNTSYRRQLGINWSDNVNLALEATNLSRADVNLTLLNSTQLLDIELTAMENKGQGEVISKPKVITANNQHASIRSGQEFAVFNRDRDGNNTSTTFKQALLSLDVTPQIIQNNQIKLTLSIAQDALTGFDDGIPIIDITKLDTTVAVNDGETIVLGGLYQISESNDIEKVPYFNRIPLLGKLFKRKLDHRTKQEVLVFITPTILPSNSVVSTSY